MSSYTMNLFEPDPPPQPARDVEQARVLRDRAIQRVSDGQPSLEARLLMAVAHVAYRQGSFTTEECKQVAHGQWSLPLPKEPRLWGAVMTKAAKEGTCEPTSQWRQGTDPTAHGRPVRVWRSLIHSARKAG